MNYKALCFDADGMIIVSKRFSEQIQKDYNISWDKMESFFKGPFQLCKRGHADLKVELANVVADWGWKGGVDELIMYWFSLSREVDQSMMELIQSLRGNGVKCYLTTNQEQYRIDHLRHTLKLDSMFDDIFVSSEIGYTKDQNGFFEYLDTQITLPKHEVLFSDDEPKNIQTAKEFGFATYLYKNDFKTFQDYLNQ